MSPSFKDQTWHLAKIAKDQISPRVQISSNGPSSIFCIANCQQSKKIPLGHYILVKLQVRR